jgi:opacity protein-like surface antigen
VKKVYVLGLCLLVAAALAMPGPARAAMWVGGELGANLYLADANADVTVNGFQRKFSGLAGSPSVLGGLTIGYDFVNRGFGAYNYPSWMKYFSVATDFTYNRINFPNTNVTIHAPNGVTTRGLFPLGIDIGATEGYNAAWSFLLIGHYGFFPDSECPDGRVSPYLGAGPCIMFSGFDIGSLGSKSTVNVGVTTELGVRFMALKNVSVDVGFRYRFFQPNYDFNNFGGRLSFSMDSMDFTFLTRAAYHF